MSIGDRVLQIRKENKMTQDDFAKKIKLSKNFVWMLEKGERVPSDRTISDICREFSISEEWLKTGNGDMYIIPIEEDALIISELIEKDSPVYDLVKSIIKIYKDLDAKSQEVLEKFCVDLADELTNPKK
jgi:Predicted transcriptional regulators